QPILDQGVGDAFSKRFYWRHNELSERFFECFDNVCGRREVPKEPLFGDLFEFSRGLAVEWVCGRHQNRFAQPVERQDTPFFANFGWKLSRQLIIDVVFLQGKKSGARLV